MEKICKKRIYGSRTTAAPLKVCAASPEMVRQLRRSLAGPAAAALENLVGAILD